MTMTEATPTTETATVIIGDARAIARVLSNVSLFTPNDYARPILQFARVTCEGDLAAFEATDSYALYRERVSVSEADGTFYVHRDAMAAAAKQAKAQKRGQAATAPLPANGPRG